MNNKINSYFKNKDINAFVLDYIEQTNVCTYRIRLLDIAKMNKFNNTMIKELTYILNHKVNLIIGKDIKIEVILKENTPKTSNNLAVDIGNTDLKPLKLSFKQDIHLLIAGNTGSGKSVFLNNLINELIKNYNNEIEFMFIDLKQVELIDYQQLNTNCCDVAIDIAQANYVLDCAINIMTDRYNIYKNLGVKTIYDYNKIVDIEDKDRELFVVIDELAELMLVDKKNIQDKLQRLLQLGRAAGIHVIAATQRPSTDVLAGTLKVNFTTRVCFKVSNIYDSKTALGFKGAELLRGNGDGYILKNGHNELIRFQGLVPCSNEALEENKREISNKKSYNWSLSKVNTSTLKEGIKVVIQILEIIALVISNILIWTSTILLAFNNIGKKRKKKRW